MVDAVVAGKLIVGWAAEIELKDKAADAEDELKLISGWDFFGLFLFLFFLVLLL